MLTFKSRLEDNSWFGDTIWQINTDEIQFDAVSFWEVEKPYAG